MSSVGWLGFTDASSSSSFSGVITGLDNTRVISCVFITLLCDNYFPPKFVTHKNLDLLLYSFPSCPAVVCSGLWFVLQWPAMVCCFQTYPQNGPASNVGRKCNLPKLSLTYIICYQIARRCLSWTRLQNRKKMHSQKYMIMTLKEK